jgi:hypothetical protein
MIISGASSLLINHPPPLRPQPPDGELRRMIQPTVWNVYSKLCRGWMPACADMISPELPGFGGRRGLEAGRAKTVLGGVGRHRQTKGFGGAPAVASETAVKLRAATRAGEPARCGMIVSA